MSSFNIHGWERLSSANPNVVEARNEVLRQLSYVPERHRANWEKRLKSKLDHSHLSVRLEIYLHHFFRERGWAIEIEPKLPNTRNSPDFLLTKGQKSMMVEAKAVLGPESERQQDARLMQLTDDLSEKLNRTVLIHPVIDLPSSLPNRHIAGEIERKASEVELLQEFPIEGEHQGQPYLLEVTVLLEEKPTPHSDVGATIGQAFHVDIGHPVRRAIQDKAGKYGEIDIPFVIALWPNLPFHFPDEGDDIIALCGDEEWLPTSSDIIVQHRPNGVFTLKREEGSYRYSHVSAVLICRPDTADVPKIYHNPFAKHPVDIKAFEGIPQCVFYPAMAKRRWL